MVQPAADWNAEATDAKGYWVTTPDLVERVDVDWDELQPTAERTAEAALAEAVPRMQAPPARAKIPLPRAKVLPVPSPRVARKVRTRPLPEEGARLPVAPVAEASLPAALNDGFDVPEFTLSEKPGSPKTPQVAERARWEILDTYVPNEVEDASTEEVARAPATNVKVFARSQAFSEAISHNIPRASSHGVSIEGASAEGEVLSDPPPITSRGPVVRVHLDPEPVPPAAAPELSMDAKRALARAMAAKAMTARAGRARDPGSLPPVEELLGQTDVLSVRSLERWMWDEADPLATPLPAETPTPAPHGPSLSLVRSAPATETYSHTLATPLPAPPRPDVLVPWPLPSMRARIGQPLQAPGPEFAELDSMDSVRLDEMLPDDVVPQSHTPSERGTSWGMWIAVGLALSTMLLAAAIGSLAMFCLVVLAAVLG